MVGAEPHRRTRAGQDRPGAGCLSVVIKKDLPADVRSRLSAWFAAPPAGVGLPPTKFKPEAGEVQARLRARPVHAHGPARRDPRQRTRCAKAAGPGGLADRHAYREGVRDAPHPRRRLGPLCGEELKDIAFNAAQDDFSALGKIDKLDTNRAVIFACNGAECWKSYKAARVAQQKGFKKVHWLRGGLPEWEAEGLPCRTPRPDYGPALHSIKAVAAPNLA